MSETDKPSTDGATDIGRTKSVRRYDLKNPVTVSHVSADKPSTAAETPKYSNNLLYEIAERLSEELKPMYCSMSPVPIDQIRGHIASALLELAQHEYGRAYEFVSSSILAPSRAGDERCKCCSCKLGKCVHEACSECGGKAGDTNAQSWVQDQNLIIVPAQAATLAETEGAEQYVDWEILDQAADYLWQTGDGPMVGRLRQLKAQIDEWVAQVTRRLREDSEELRFIKHKMEQYFEKIVSIGWVLEQFERLREERDRYRDSSRTHSDFRQRAETEAGQLAERMQRALDASKSPCGHFARYSKTEDGGKHIICLECEVKRLREERNRDIESSYDEGLAEGRDRERAEWREI